MNENTNVALDIADELRIEGVNCKGYGIIPKFVMLDRDLSIDAKGIYAYFCSYSGSGNTLFPGRDKIIHDLSINKDSYYKHYKQLLDNGYITVSQENAGGQGHGFSKNLYTLVSNPKKFSENPNDSHLNLAYSNIRTKGLQAAGYGCIAKAVMTDARLSLKAKALYAYLASFLGSGDTACPKKDTILFHLGITDKTYRKFSAELVNLNYICIVQRHVGGRLGVNDFYLNDNPDIDQVTHDRKVQVIQCGKISDTQNIDKVPEITEKPDEDIIFAPCQCGNFSDTLIQDTQKQDAQISDTNNINNINNNNLYHEQRTNHQQETGRSTAGSKGEEDELLSIRQQLKITGTIPAWMLKKKKTLTEALKVLTDFNRFGNESFYPDTEEGHLNFTLYKLYFDALVSMLSQKKSMTLLGEEVSSEEVCEKLNGFIKTVSLSDEMKELLGIKEESGLYIDFVQDEAVECYRKASKATQIGNPLAYMKACIWNALLTGGNGSSLDIVHDFYPFL